MAATTKNQKLIEEIKHSAVPVPWCDEFERMVSGMNFSAANSQAMLDYKLATMKLLKSFNDDLIPDEYTLAMLKARRMSVAKQMMGKLGCGVNIEPPFFCGWGCNIFIGEGVYINREVSIYDNAAVVIGDRVLIGPGVCVCTGTHEVEPRARQESKNGSFAQPIRIESDCWIGARVTILPGVRIGRGSIIAAGAVVSKDVEEDCVAGGVPAKIIKRLNGAINGSSNGASKGAVNGA